MYLIDTNVISEARKGPRANPGVRHFLRVARQQRQAVFLSVVTVGELRRGAEHIRHRGDHRQAQVLASWLAGVLDEFGDWVLDIDSEVAQLWGVLRAAQPHHALDKLIAATALIHGLAVVTRNTKDFSIPGLEVVNPFTR